MTERVGLLGWPVEHSLSPVMHNAAFTALDLNWRYDLLPVPPEHLNDTVERLIGEGYRGFNVTVPHKHAILSCLPGRLRPDESVTSVGAANTLIVQADGSLIATNTDWKGFAEDLRAYNIEVSGKSCLVLGTGGTAHAVAYALAQMAAASVTFASRNPQKITLSPVVSYDTLYQISFDVLINTTPVGMWPKVNQSPWPENVPIPAHCAVYDVIYNPGVTRLMLQAKSNGARAVSGLGMLVRQGAYAFECWTGITPPVDVMANAAQSALGLTERK